MPHNCSTDDKRTTAHCLSDRFKKSGEFDRLRRELLTQFQRGVSSRSPPASDIYLDIPSRFVRVVLTTGRDACLYRSYRGHCAPAFGNRSEAPAPSTRRSPSGTDAGSRQVSSRRLVVATLFFFPDLSFDRVLTSCPLQISNCRTCRSGRTNAHRPNICIGHTVSRRKDTRRRPREGALVAITHRHGRSASPTW